MIWTVVQTSWRRLKNNRSELVLTFIVPILFFSIFAVIFGSRDASSTTPKIKIVVCDEQHSSLSTRSMERLMEQKSLRITNKSSGDTIIAITRAQAEDLVRRGMASAAIVFPKANQKTEQFDAPKVEVLSDSFDQVASQVMTAVVQKSVLTAQAEIAKEKQAAMRANNSVVLASGVLTSSPSSMDGRIASGPALENVEIKAPSMTAMPEVVNIDLMGGKKTNPVVAMYAAGIAVMFLLFSATTASGSLLEERENSTLDRLLCSRLTMDQLLLGKWTYLTIIGCIQMLLMFTWGALVFKIDVLRHWEGFAAMTLVTAGASSSFALLLASLCKSRMQLGWVSTIVILSMSALGGSMVPRYLMSETIQKVGLCTFNAWALEGFNKVFWRELPLDQIGAELAVLTGCGALFIVLARVFAIRWERS
jgi:ABC-2 type transport system permease protein